MSEHRAQGAGNLVADRLISDLRTFMLSYGDHDSECPGRDANGPDAISDANCTCGFIGRMNALLAEVAERISDHPKAKP